MLKKNSSAFRPVVLNVTSLLLERMSLTFYKLFSMLLYKGRFKMSMVNCIRFRPKKGCETIIIQETSKIYKTLDGALEKRLVELGEGEYASVIVWKSMDAFLEVLNRDVRLIDVLRPHVEPYDDGQEFHAFSGPSVELSAFD